MSGWNEDDLETVHFYEHRLGQFGEDARSLNWGSRQSQERRFEVLASIGDLANQSILDVGCGLGDFYRWLVSRGIQTDYTGIDLTPGMVEKAASRNPSARFAVHNLLGDTAPFQEKSFDFVFASGIFYLRRIQPQEYMQEMISTMFCIARKGVAFNSLSTWSTERDALEYYADPIKTLEWCAELSKNLILRHDYHPGDFSILMKK